MNTDDQHSFSHIRDNVTAHTASEAWDWLEAKVSISDIIKVPCSYGQVQPEGNPDQLTATQRGPEQTGPDGTCALQ